VYGLLFFFLELRVGISNPERQQIKFVLSLQTIICSNICQLYWFQFCTSSKYFKYCKFIHLVLKGKRKICFYLFRMKV